MIVDDEETLTAYHEAGHAVIAYALGATIESVQLGGEADEWLPERFGECRISWGRVDATSNWQLQREVLSVLAGPVAEMIYRGETPHPASFGPWQHDWKFAWTLSAELVRDPARRSQVLEGLIVWLHNRMRTDQCWAAVAAVADEILAHEFVDGEMLENTLDFWV